DPKYLCSKLQLVPEKRVVFPSDGLERLDWRIHRQLRAKQQSVRFLTECTGAAEPIVIFESLEPVVEKRPVGVLNLGKLQQLQVLNCPCVQIPGLLERRVLFRIQEQLDGCSSVLAK